MLLGSFLPAECPCQSIFHGTPGHCFPTASFLYPRSYKKSATPGSWQQRMAGEVLQTDLNPQDQLKCLKQPLQALLAKGSHPLLKSPGQQCLFPFPTLCVHVISHHLGWQTLLSQHSVSPRFSICSSPAPLQQQEVSPFPSPAMCVPQAAQISSPNPPTGTFLPPPRPWSVQMCPLHPSCSLPFGLRARANPAAPTKPQSSSWGGPHHPPWGTPGAPCLKLEQSEFL